jgi:hypothetical protein
MAEHEDIPTGYDRLSEPVTVFWYEHDCDWITKYCDEHHRRSGTVSRIVLETVTQH